MSKYTTTVRDICNEIMLKNENLMMPNSNTTVDEALQKTWDKIFEPFVFYLPELRAQFCIDILKHYYTREIGFETVGLWKLKLNTRMHEIMPYYNKRFESAAIQFNPLFDVDYTRTLEGKEHGENNRAENTDRSGEGSNIETYKDSKDDEGSSHGVSKFSDTPQGWLVGLENNQYLTNATINDNSGESKSETTGNRNASNTSSEKIGVIGTGAFATTNNIIEHVVGKRGGMSYSKAIMEYRDTLINVELEVFDELRDLFMLLW